MNPESSPEQALEHWQILADELLALQETENSGRGFQTARTIASCLRGGDIERAKAVCNTEGDKIRNYPEIKTWLEEYVMGKPWLEA